jgi:hypothetical protein
MTTDQQLNQPNLFEDETIEIEKLSLYALGEFQSRGLRLADRELALDRLLGAFKRAAEVFQTEELSDEKIAEGLKKLGVRVKQVPSFVAKHPYRVTVSSQTAELARRFYNETLRQDKSV